MLRLLDLDIHIVGYLYLNNWFVFMINSFNRWKSSLLLVKVIHFKSKGKITSSHHDKKCSQISRFFLYPTNPTAIWGRTSRQPFSHLILYRVRAVQVTTSASRRAFWFWWKDSTRRRLLVWLFSSFIFFLLRRKVSDWERNATEAPLTVMSLCEDGEGGSSALGSEIYSRLWNCGLRELHYSSIEAQKSARTLAELVGGSKSIEGWRREAAWREERRGRGRSKETNNNRKKQEKWQWHKKRRVSSTKDRLEG